MLSVERILGASVGSSSERPSGTHPRPPGTDDPRGPARDGAAVACVHIVGHRVRGERPQSGGCGAAERRPQLERVRQPNRALNDSSSRPLTCARAGRATRARERPGVGLVDPRLAGCLFRSAPAPSVTVIYGGVRREPSR
jgi:hypothetical protein